MTESRGTPPNEKQLKAHLGARRPLWDNVVEMVKEFGATWRWMHSEATGQWSYRAYLPGDRFFVALSLVPEGMELSLNLKTEEWDWVPNAPKEEQEFLDELRTKALATGDDPAWVHVPVTSQATLPAIAKLMFARGRRVQAPRGKKRR